MDDSAASLSGTGHDSSASLSCPARHLPRSCVGRKGVRDTCGHGSLRGAAARRGHERQLEEQERMQREILRLRLEQEARLAAAEAERERRRSEAAEALRLAEEAARLEAQAQERLEVEREQMLAEERRTRQATEEEVELLARRAREASANAEREQRAMAERRKAERQAARLRSEAEARREEEVQARADAEAVQRRRLAEQRADRIHAHFVDRVTSRPTRRLQIAGSSKGPCSRSRVPGASGSKSASRTANAPVPSQSIHPERLSHDRQPLLASPGPPQVAVSIDARPGALHV